LRETFFCTVLNRSSKLKVILESQGNFSMMRW